MKHFLDWSSYEDAGMGDAYADIPKQGGDFAKAVAVCINSKQCETDNKLVMCPSYKVSHNPNLSTGGRVRLLKAALSSDFVDQALDDQALAEAMDLCVSCKGCKRECENNVDMPLIKAEYLAQRAHKHGFSYRSYILAYTPHWLHDFPILKSFIRWRNKSALLSKLTHALFKIDGKQPLAEPARTPLIEQATSGDSSKPEVILFVDTFSRHFEPEIVEAAQKVLKVGGYAVSFAPIEGRPLCCGRTYLAQGMIDRARAEAKRLCEALKPHIDAGKTIIGLEASCVLGLRDDAKALGLGAIVEEVAAHTFLFEEFLTKEIRAKRLELPLNALKGSKTLIHGHCHQKAVGAMKAMRHVLKLIPDHDFEIIESGCCGMAGSFGIEAEHVDMARDMAEQSLLPTLRDNPDAVIVANGFSCRQQIKGHLGRTPQHLAILLAKCLKT
jgi:glycerol-3-phosphate dehydrogenase subunit C